MIRSRIHVTAILGLAQTLAWASSYYLPAILAPAMARELAIGTPLVFAGFSVALIASALAGPLAGRMIDRRGGRPVLMASSIVFAIGLFALAYAAGPVTMFTAWLLMGVGMGCGLYDAAFATLVRLFGAEARNSITGVTLMAGFASTIGWPTTAWLELHVGWRGACLAWAAAHLLVNLALYTWLPSSGAHAQQTGTSAAGSATGEVAGSRARTVGVLLALIFAASWFVSTAMAAHLPQLVVAAGASLAAAVGIGALVGPAQVIGRVVEFTWLRHHHPLLSALLAALAHPLGVAILLVAGAPAAPAFAVLHGMGNGILTIANGALPLVLLGHKDYGSRQGWLMMPARFAQASAPFLFGLALSQWQAAALWMTAALGMCSFLALLMIERLRFPSTR